MPEDKKPEEGQEKDTLGNFKSEVNRKIDSVKDALTQTTNELKQQLKALIPLPEKKTASAPEKTIKELWWEDEEAAANRILAIADERLDKKLQDKDRQANVMGGLFNDFPELRNMQDPLTVKALEIYNNLPAHDKTTPSAYRLAVLEAAAEIGVSPMAKRTKNENDDWTSDGGNTPPPTRRGKKNSDELSPESLAFAAAVGMDTDDPKIMERLKKSAKRQNWTKYQ